MLIAPLQVAPGSPAILGWCRSFAAATHGIAAAWGHGQEGFETHITFPVGAKIVDLPKPFAPMEGEAP